MTVTPSPPTATPAPEPPAIEVTGLSKHFGEVAAVEDVSFTVAAGSTVALLGGNGAGKTTTLSILVGLLLPTAGRVRVLGEDMLAHRYRVLHRLNYSTPYVDIPHRLRVIDNLKVFAGLYGVLRPAERIEQMAEGLDITHLLKRPYGELSSGQKTRVSMAKALLNAPDLLLMDEPTASLDPDMADYVRGYLQTYQQQTGATMLLASHNMSEVERICDNVLILRGGRIVAQGDPQSLLQRYGRKNLEEVFIDIARNRSKQDPSALGDDGQLEFPPGENT